MAFQLFFLHLMFICPPRLQKTPFFRDNAYTKGYANHVFKSIIYGFCDKYKYYLKNCREGSSVELLFTV